MTDLPISIYTGTIMKKRKLFKKINPDMRFYFCKAYAEKYLKAEKITACPTAPSKEKLVEFLKAHREGLKFIEEIYEIVISLA
jgi:hypothetical protein